jgi:hypothetical protein
MTRKAARTIGSHIKCLNRATPQQPAGSPTQGAGEDKDKTDYWPLSKLKKCYTDYLFNKREEIDEATDARRYYHGTQWTSEQLKGLKKRKQPAMTFNRMSRKINGTVGLIEKLRQDPKAYARTPSTHRAPSSQPQRCAICWMSRNGRRSRRWLLLDGAIDGIGGIEIEIEQGDHGDPEIGFEDVDIQSFFYDPRSFEPDFADARYQGMGKWVDQDIAESMFPDAQLGELTGDTDLTTITTGKPAGSLRSASKSGFGWLTSGTSTKAAGAGRSLPARPFDGGQVLSQGREGQGPLQIHHVLGQRRSGRRSLRPDPQYEVGTGRD